MTLKPLYCLVLIAAVGGFLGGCESFESAGGTLRDRMTGVPPKVRVFAGEPRQVYAAARRAMELQEYRYLSGGPAQGRLEGITRIGLGRDFGSSRQRSISIQLEPLDGGQTQVSVLLTEIAQDSADGAAGGPTETPLRDSSSYEVFFAELQRQLQSGKVE